MLLVFVRGIRCDTMERQKQCMVLLYRIDKLDGSGIGIGCGNAWCFYTQKVRCGG